MKFIQTLDGDQINLDHVVRIVRGRRVREDDTIFMADGSVIRCRILGSASSDAISITDIIAPACATDEAIVAFDYGPNDTPRVEFFRWKIVAWSVHPTGGADPIFSDDVLDTSNATVGVIQPDGSVTSVPVGAGEMWDSVDSFKAAVLKRAGVTVEAAQ